MKCPACDNRGPWRHETSHFEVRGQVDGTAIRKCKRCGVGIAVKGFGRGKLIPERTWEKMQNEWARTFPVTDPFRASQSVLLESFDGNPPYADLFDPATLDASSMEDRVLNGLERTLRVEAAESARQEQLLSILRDEQERRGLEPWPADYQPPPPS